MVKLIWKYVKKYWYLAILAPIFMILEVYMDMILASYMEQMIDVGIQTSNIDFIIKCGVKMIFIVLVGVVCGIASGIFTNLTSHKAINDLRKDLFSKIMHLSYHQTDKFQTGSLVTRVTNDTTSIQQMINMSLRMMVRQLSMMILGTIMVINIDKRFGMLLLFAIPLLLLIMGLFAFKATPYFSIMQKKIDRVNTVVHENLTGARVVKAFNKEDYESSRFEKVNDDHVKTMWKVNVILAFLMPLLMLVVYGLNAAIYSIGGKDIINNYNSWLMNGLIGENALMIGEVNQAITYITMICFGLMMFGMLIIYITRSIASSKRIIEVLETEIEIRDGDFDISNKKLTGTIEFKDVSFHYPDDKDDVLDKINLKINKGETIAIVGGTGSGKSTLVNLLTRFYDVTDGELMVDGINVKDYKQNELRDLIAICLQKAELFAGTIRDNIKWGNENASEIEVIKASEIAQAKEFIDSKEKGLDEWVEEKGTSLSGGQKQRLSIARAIIKKPEIIIFDDSTSALDLVTEAKLYKAMNKEIGHITKIVVAQRIATAKNADKIAVLDQGHIVAFDTHENLMKSCPIYIDIYNSQLNKEVE